MRIKLRFALAIFSLLALGCAGSGGHNPIEPESPAAPNAALSQLTEDATESNRHLWGLWKVRIGDDHQSVEVIPLRAPQMHLNALRLLQETPCADCLRIENVVIHGPNELSADLTLIHPFPGLLKYTGFDVRGIFISGSDYAFPASGRSIAWGDDKPRMLSADGYTALFNPTEFPVTKPGPPALRYIPGHRAAGGDLSATLNPFLAYAQDAPRRLFEAGGMETRNVRLHVPDGPLEFGYAVDVCWQLVDGEVTDPVNDFPPDANCLEAYKTDVQVGQGLHSNIGASALIQVEVFDHQGPETTSTVILEAPDLFTGQLELTDSTVTPENTFLFNGEITNELGAGYGDYPLLVRVVDKEPDQNLGQIDAWQLVGVGLKEGWARTWGGDESDIAYGVATDGEGNAFAAGYFKNTVDFDPGPGIDERTVIGARDLFLSKFDQRGEIVWTHTLGGEFDEWGGWLATDDANNIFVTGIFEGTVDFDPGPGTDKHTAAVGHDIFLSKIDPTGQFIWTQSWEAGGGIGLSLGVATDSTGSVYVTGYFTKIADFDPGPDIDERTANGGSDAFLCKYSTSGDYLWTRTWGGPGGTWGDQGTDVACDGVGSIYVSGVFNNTADFDPGPGVEERTTNGGKDTYLSRFSTDGEFLWVRAWGGRRTYDSGDGVDADAAGNVYVAGRFRNNVDFDPGPGVEERNGHAYQDNAYLSRFDAAGDFHWVWTLIAKPDDSTWLDGCGVCIGQSGDVYITGTFGTTKDFDPGPGIEERTSNGSDDVFVSAFTIDGELQWVSAWGGASREQPNSITIDDSGNLFVSGYFRETADFDPGPSVEHHTSNGDIDSFLCKLLPDGGW